MTDEADPPRPRLQFGPRVTNDRPIRRIALLSLRLFMVVALLAMFTRSAFDLSGSDGSGNGGLANQGTALIEPRDDSPKLPPGMILASAVTAAQSPERSENKSEPDGQAITPNEPGAAYSSAVDGPERTRAEDLPFLMESLVDLDRDLPPALYYHFLDKARQAEPERLIADARRDVTFAHLYKDPRNDPPKYRGQLIGLRGTVRRAVAYDVDPNAYGLKKRYELWIFTEDSGKFPWVVELTNLPEGFPLGTDLQERVETAGYFLKLWAYRAQDGFRSAPVLLGHGLVWQRNDLIRERFDRGFALVAFGFLGLFAILIGSSVWRWNREDRLRKEARAATVYDRLDDIPRNDGTGDGSFSS
ncbi:hypothetical protein GC170_03720 [bacterium]|nr:hypothetical protein [bacterium]